MQKKDNAKVKEEIDFYKEIIEEKKDNEADEELIFQEDDRSGLKSREPQMAGSKSGGLAARSSMSRVGPSRGGPNIPGGA